jgi:FKBP-type peptidyl-prolyl cis-trans isomerase
MRLRDRIFAGFGALLFFVSAIAATAFVLIDANTNSGTDTDPTQTAQECTYEQATETLPVPEVYKPEGRVTELQTTDLEPGTGAAAKKDDCLVMKYYGTLASDGTMFDENFTKPTAFAFTLGAGRVIPGWDQGLVGMKEGGTRRLVIPAELAYGAAGSCREYDATDQTKCNVYAIPPDSDLVFVVKLVKIQT